LPKDFPPFTTVQHHFYGWRDSGLIVLINEALVLGGLRGQFIDYGLRGLRGQFKGLRGQGLRGQFIDYGLRGQFKK
jgi:hypothetical protein